MSNQNKLDQEASNILRQVYQKTSGFWGTAQTNYSLTLFHKAAKQVPAYKDFLRKNKINPKKIKTADDFTYVPTISKKNYLQNYSLQDLAWPKTFTGSTIFTSTSGSTSQPFFFPRERRLDWQSSITHEMFLRWGTHDLKKPILIIDGFGMGVWIGGLITYKAFEIIGQRDNLPLSLITPGVNKNEVLRILATLGSKFEQVILTGYPPFVKDIIDEAVQTGINLKQMHLRLLFAAEPFTENFREYLVNSAGVKNLYLDTSNIYGTADLGTTSSETPVSILIRRLALKQNKLFNRLFGIVHKTPTLTQFNPNFINFQAENGELLMTGNNSVPLVRYAIGDNGGVFNFNQAKQYLKEFNFDLYKEAKNCGIQKYLTQLPFVYVYERKDFSIKLRLHDIHPEIIRDALTNSYCQKILTGKFAMTTRYNNKNNQYLELNLELKKSFKASQEYKKNIQTQILNALKLKASGPGNINELIKQPGLVKLLFWPYEHSNYFKAGVKQKWTINR